MDIFSVIAFLGGLAFFLYGMSMLGDGLSRASGGKMEKILEKLTNSRFKAVLLGAGVTAVIQSSSATTVMVVGFVNAGIMKLNQAVGLIMGANIGTTATSWILSLTGLQGNNFWIKMLKPTSFAPILAIVGAFILMLSKNEKKRNVATIMVGFAILMSGMTAMSSAVEPLAEVPEFGQILVKFANPVAGVLAGMIITAIIQSSSASVGILQALCATGNVTYGLAIPIIMGQNIGTCITAIMSAIGANKNAKRAAAIHLYFNLIGTIVCLVLFYGINAFVHFNFLTDAIGPANIAIIHSVFNIFTTVILLPFGNQLVKLAQLTVGKHEEKSTTSEEMQIPVLDERFLERPALAAEYSYVAAKRMAYLSRESLLSAMDLFENYDEKKAERIAELEETVDQYEDKIGSYLVQLSSKNLSDTDSRSLTMLLHCIGDFERISDHAVSLMRSAKEMEEKNLQFSKSAEAEISVFRASVRDIVDTAFSAFVTDNVQEAKKVEPLEDVIDDINIQVRDRHVRRLQEGQCTIQLGFILSDICTDMERISDHCSNISAYQVQQHESEYDPHAYSTEIRDHEEFRKQREKYRELYMLPQL